MIYESIHKVISIYWLIPVYLLGAAVQRTLDIHYFTKEVREWQKRLERIRATLAL